MNRRRCSQMAAAIALCGVALAAAGCGLGPGKDLGEVSLRVSRDFGAHQVQKPVEEGVTEADTAMRVLERKAEIETRYSGGFVQSIDGLEENEGDGGSPEDWFFYVNGVESGVGAAQYPLHGGESIWWDYHDWGAAIHIPAVVGAYPEPLLDGYEGERHPVAVVCEAAAAACATVRERLANAGVEASARASGDAIRVLVGTWERLRDDPAAAQIERGPGQSGVYAEPVAQNPSHGRETRHRSGCAIEALDEGGDPARRLGPGAGLVAATRRYEAPPTWVVTGCDPAGVRRAAALLDTGDLDGRFAAAAQADGAPMALPVEGR